MRADGCNVIPTCLSVAPCSWPSRPSPSGGREERPALTAPARGARKLCRPGRRNGDGTNKGTDKEETMT